MELCVALEWGLDDESQKYYVPCDSTDAEPCRLVGLLLAVDAHLCREHQRYFAKQPKGWGLVKVFDLKTKRRIEYRPYGTQRFLSAEKLEPTTKRERKK